MKCAIARLIHSLNLNPAVIASTSFNKLASAPPKIVLTFTPPKKIQERRTRNSTLLSNSSQRTRIFTHTNQACMDTGGGFFTPLMNNVFARPGMGTQIVYLIKLSRI